MPKDKKQKMVNAQSKENSYPFLPYTLTILVFIIAMSLIVGWIKP
jgi:hypothetical protein